MKKIARLLVITATLLLTSLTAKASHIVGGEIYYDSLGNNMYKITIEVFRDCGSATDFDNPVEYTVFYGDGTFWGMFSVPIFSRNVLPIVYDDPCVDPPNDICIERAIYIDTLTLPFDVTGYHISYQRCCWAANIENIVSPDQNGITLTNYIPGSSLVDVHNQGARFINYPPLVLCSNNTLTFDHSAFDPDGDSLAYEIAAPYLGGSSGSVTPNPETPPPYTDVTWEAGFSAAQPFGVGSSIIVDPITGMVDFTPDMIGTFVAGIAVKEYREGILINTKIRTYGYRVVACEAVIPLVIELAQSPGVPGIPSTAQLLEDCGDLDIVVRRLDSTYVLGIDVLVTGTAINGVDFTYISDTLTLPIGVLSDTIHVETMYDQITEGNETFTISIIVQNLCGSEEFDTTTMTVTVLDYIDMTITETDSVNVCADFGEGTYLWCNVQNGYPPYSYYWTPAMPNNDTVIVTPNMLQPNLNQFYVIAGDACGKSIQSGTIDVYNQCPLIVPNVMTPNEDGTNDALIIANLEDFDKVELKIFNRWGALIYENGAYQNDWKGIDKGGEPLNDGTYFYLVTPVSEKYEYDDQQKTLYTLHGFFQLVSKK